MSYVQVTIVESSGSQANGGDAAGPSSKYVIDGEETVVDATKKTQTLTSTSAHLGSWWRVAVVGSDAVLGECAAAPAFTNRATAMQKGRVYLGNSVEYLRVVGAGEKWAFISA